MHEKMQRMLSIRGASVDGMFWNTSCPETNDPAAKVTNAKPVLVRTGKGDCTMLHFAQTLDVPVYDDLAYCIRQTPRQPH